MVVAVVSIINERSAGEINQTGTNSGTNWKESFGAGSSEASNGSSRAHWLKC